MKTPSGLSGKERTWVNSALTLLTNKRTVIRLGFALVLGFLLFSTVEAYQIQKSLSQEASEIYHRHVKQDDALYRLRRTIWIGSMLSRDLLLNPHADRDKVVRDRLPELMKTSTQALEELDAAASPKNAALKARVQDFWDLLQRVPQETGPLNNAERYEWVQKEIVPRRNSVGQLLRDFTEVSLVSLQTNEAAFVQTRRQNARNLMGVLGLSLMFALAVAIVSLAHSESLERETQSRYEEVTEAKIELQRLAARLMEIQESERARISREMHDEIGQSLATLRIEITYAESLSKERLPDVGERLRRARELAERTVQTVRNMCSLLRPSILDDLGLEAALDCLVEDFSWRTGMNCTLQQKGLRADISESAKTCVFRVVQESMHNCQKHSRAKTLAIRVTQTNSALEVSIEDDGIGFEVRSPKERVSAGQFGILGMFERAAALGGTLGVDSRPGSGAIIKLTLPIETLACPSESLSEKSVNA